MNTVRDQLVGEDRYADTQFRKNSFYLEMQSYNNVFSSFNSLGQSLGARKKTTPSFIKIIQGSGKAFTDFLKKKH